MDLGVADQEHVTVDVVDATPVALGLELLDGHVLQRQATAVVVDASAVVAEGLVGDALDDQLLQGDLGEVACQRQHRPRAAAAQRRGPRLRRARADDGQLLVAG